MRMIAKTVEKIRSEQFADMDPKLPAKILAVFSNIATDPDDQPNQAEVRELIEDHADDGIMNDSV